MDHLQSRDRVVGEYVEFLSADLELLSHPHPRDVTVEGQGALQVPNGEADMKEFRHGIFLETNAVAADQD